MGGYESSPPFLYVTVSITFYSTGGSDMSTFKVEVLPIQVSEHPNADALEIAQILGYNCVIRKGSFVSGDLVVYIPEDAIVPEDLLEEIGLTGKLGGSAKNRVKAMRLRGVLSQGICIPCKDPKWVRGTDVQQELGITKYEPRIPTSLGGIVYNAGPARCVKYGIENLKNYPDTFEPGEPVSVTEKIHGTFACFGVMPSSLVKDGKELVVCSKGLGAQGLAFKIHSETADPGLPGHVLENPKNVYVRTALGLDIVGRVMSSPILRAMVLDGLPVFVLGEIFGRGIQDMYYNKDIGGPDSHTCFRIFDIAYGVDDMRAYLNPATLTIVCGQLGIPQVPVLYVGPYSAARIAELSEEKEHVSGASVHLSEGVVIKPMIERRNPDIGRVVLKNKSEAYLLRKDGTEHS